MDDILLLYIAWQISRKSERWKADKDILFNELEDELINELAARGWLNEQGQFDPNLVI